MYFQHQKDVKLLSNAHHMMDCLFDDDWICCSFLFHVRMHNMARVGTNWSAFPWSGTLPCQDWRTPICFGVARWPKHYGSRILEREPGNHKQKRTFRRVETWNLTGDLWHTAAMRKSLWIKISRTQLWGWCLTTVATWCNVGKSQSVQWDRQVVPTEGFYSTDGNVGESQNGGFNKCGGQ